MSGPLVPLVSSVKVRFWLKSTPCSECFLNGWRSSAAELAMHRTFSYCCLFPTAFSFNSFSFLQCFLYSFFWILVKLNVLILSLATSAQMREMMLNVLFRTELGKTRGHIKIGIISYEVTTWICKIITYFRTCRGDEVCMEERRPGLAFPDGEGTLLWNIF